MNKPPYILEYVWIDGIGQLRSKYKTVMSIKFDDWNYDGSSTYQASAEKSEIILHPVATFHNPFFPDGKAKLVLCDTYYDYEKKKPTKTNHRVMAEEIFNKRQDMFPWYGIEQEYFMYPKDIIDIIKDNTLPQGDYYCGVGSKYINKQMRSLAEKHYLYCINAEISISGINAEVAPNQWEFQIGPCIGIDASDQLWMARYILQKLGEEYNMCISFKPKPLPNPWNGSGLHTNFSTRETRGEDGLEKIYDYIISLSDEEKHASHISVYGDNSERLNGICETSDINKFTYGMGNRNCSVRIPNSVIKDGRGYIEDRRPASDADPYQVTSIIFQTCCL